MLMVVEMMQYRHSNVTDTVLVPVQIQCRYSADTVQIQCKYSADTVQNRYSTDTVQIQCRCSVSVLCV